MIDRYKCPEISGIWSDNYKYYLWLRIELTFLKYFRGVSIPMPKIFDSKWVNQIAEIETKTHHDVAAFVEWLEEYVKEAGYEDYARWVHYGLTSSDITDTCFSMQIAQSNTICRVLLDKVFTALNNLSYKHGSTYMIGRTHGQAAERIEFWRKLQSYHYVLAANMPSQVYYGKLSGSVGDYKYFKQEVANNTLEELGLQVCGLQDGQIIHRSVYANYMNQWAMMASVIAKIATDIRLLSQSCIEEVQEGFAEGQVGSSSMPQKKNPIISENLCGLARVIRGYQATAMENIELWLERDISHSSAERMIFPDAVGLLGYMINRLHTLLSNLQVNEKKIAENLAKYSDQMESQAKMLQMINKGSSRKEAHEKMRT